MKSLLIHMAAVAALLLSESLVASEFSYATIEKRYAKSALSSDKLRNAQMQGECLVGLKELNFKRKNKFDPVAEWGNYRSLSLLEQFPPCEVLVMMEVAQSRLRSDAGIDPQ